MTTQNPLGLKKIHHVEFYVGNAKQAEFYYRKAFGFSRAGYMGLETGNREVTSYLMRQTNINFVLTTPMSPEHPAAEHIKQHGDGVHDIAFLGRGCRSRISRGGKTRGNTGRGAARSWRTRTARSATRRSRRMAIRSIRSSRTTTSNGHNYYGPISAGICRAAGRGRSDRHHAGRSHRRQCRARQDDLLVRFLPRCAWVFPLHHV